MLHHDPEAALNLLGEFAKELVGRAAIPESEDRRLAGYFAGVVAAGAVSREASTPFRT